LSERVAAQLVKGLSQQEILGGFTEKRQIEIFEK